MAKNIEKIKRLEKNHRLLSENLIDAIWTADVKTLKFEYMTESIKKISGYTSNEYLDLPLKERMSPESFQKIESLLAEEIPNFKKDIKNVRTLEIEVIHKTGVFYWAELKARLFQEPGKTLKIIGVTRDITGRKKAEQEKNNLIEKLGKALAEKEILLKENKKLQGLLPICSACKRIRDDDDKWWPLDAYIDKKTQAKLTHTICLDCQDAFYGDQEWYIKQQKKIRKKGDSS